MYETHLTYQDKNKIKWNRLFKILIIFLWGIFLVTTLMDLDIVYDAVSIIFSFMCLILYIKSQDIIGKYWKVARWFAIGTFIWFIADILWFLAGHVFVDNSVLAFISDNLYLLPDYMFLVGVVFYARDRFDKISLQMLLIDAFVIAIISFIILQRFFSAEYGYDFEIAAQSIVTMLYSFATLFLLIFIIALNLITRAKKHATAFYIITLMLLLFDALEIRYTFYMFMGKDPENVLLDIVFLLCIGMIAIGFSDIRLRDLDFSGIDDEEGKISKFISAHFGKMYWINSIILTLVAVGLYLIHLFDGTAFYYMITITLAYVVMCKTVQANILSEKLIESQKSENQRLERMVEEKTKELTQMNAHLEYISNIDVLTGLYNRRYGVDYLAKLIGDSDAYPVTLFSLDLNHFKPINDNYGHDIGDVVLKEVGNRLNNLGQDRCTAVRIGGDEFLLIFRNSNKTAIENMAKLICDRMDVPIETTVEGSDGEGERHELHVSACIGIATFPNDATDIETLYKMADEALYSIKHKYENSSYMKYETLLVDANS